MKSRRARWSWIVVALAVFAVLLAGALALRSDALVTAAKFHSLRDDHTGLRSFLRRMPKGGDLHVHLSGAVFAEQFIAWAMQDGLCLRVADTSIVEPPCDAAKGTVPVQSASDQKVYDRIVNSLSTRDFMPNAATPSEHDQFFAVFSKFGAVSGRRFIAQISRNNPKEDVFVQTALAAALIRAEPRVVAALNFVAPEDNQVALR